MKCACICNHSRSSDVCREEPFCLPKWWKKKKLSRCRFPFAHGPDSAKARSTVCQMLFGRCHSSFVVHLSFLYALMMLWKRILEKKKTGDLPPTSNSFSTFEQLFHCQLEETRRRLWNLCYNLLNEWNHFANLLDRRALSHRRHDVGILMALWIGRVRDFNG